MAGQSSGYIYESSNYRIQRDSINIGGADSESASYRLEDTIGEIGTGTSTSSNYNIHAGYQAMEDAVITITLSEATDLSLGSIVDNVGGTAENTKSWTVTTNNSSGYTLSIKADTDPAMKSSSDSFADYSPAGANPDYTFSIPDNQSAFGYSPEGTDIVSRFKDNGSGCNTGSADTLERCWDGFSTTNETVAQGLSSNTPGGTNTTIRFRAVVGTNKSQTVGSYNATITLTAVAL